MTKCLVHVVTDRAVQLTAAQAVQTVVYLLITYPKVHNYELKAAA